MKLGYLPRAALETEALRSEDELKEAIKAFQRYAHIRPSGEYDEETIGMMLAPRY